MQNIGVLGIYLASRGTVTWSIDWMIDWLKLIQLIDWLIDEFTFHHLGKLAEWNNTKHIQGQQPVV